MKGFLNRNKKIAMVGLVLFAVLLVFPTQTNAGIFPSAIDIMGTVFSGVSYLFSWIFGLFFMLAGALTNFMMELNRNILSTDNALVSVGWSIARDVANLGFVLIMIIIAVTTIVRYESSKYGTKLLPILIGAAILVNFSLTIAGVFINFSNTVSDTFFNNSFGNKLSINGLGDIVGGAFNPQRLLLKDEDNLQPPEPASQAGAVSTFSTALLTMIAGLIFNVIFMAIASFTLFVLALMLLYRYIFLSFLLILAPIAWMFWVFPDLKGHFSDWWNHFIKWVFFLPAVNFFIYLAVKSAEALGTKPMNAGPGFSGGLQNIMSNGMQMVVLTGLLLGGIIVAQSMSVKGAGGAVKLMTKAKDGALSFAGRKALQYGSYAARRKWGKEEPGKEPPRSAAEALVGWAGKIKMPIAKQAVGYLARGATRLSTAGGEDVLKQYESGVSKMAIPDVQAALLTASGPRRIALIKRLSKEKQLGNSDMTGIATQDTRGLFARFNQGKDFGDIEKNGLMTVDMAEAIKSGNKEALADATDKLVGGMTRKDLETAAIKDLFSGKKKFGLEASSVADLADQFARSLISTNNTSLVPNIMPKLDSKSRNNFEGKYRGVIDKLPDKTQQDKDYKKGLEEGFKQVMKNYTMGYSPIAETETGGSTPPPPAPPKP
ncbi:MAG: hypothetical protein ABSE68_03115 [Minisyncoccia bacterium]